MSNEIKDLHKIGNLFQILYMVTYLKTYTYCVHNGNPPKDIYICIYFRKPYLISPSCRHTCIVVRGLKLGRQFDLWSCKEVDMFYIVEIGNDI